MLKPFSPKVLLLALAVASPAFADDCQAIDQQLATALAQMNTYSRYNYSDETISNEEKEQKFDQAYNAFKSNFDAMIVQDSSLNCPFIASQNEGLTVKTSPDKKFRAFSWDNDTGGTMHEYSSVLQYRDSDGKVHHNELDNTNYVAQIFQMPISDKTLYLLTSVSVQSTSMRGQDLTLYQIEQDKLISPKLIKTQSGFTNSLAYEYSDIDETDNAFHFNPPTRLLDFPVVVPEKGYLNGRVTEKRIKYGFDGKYFVKK